MAQIVLNIKDEKKSKAVITFLKELGLIDSTLEAKKKGDLSGFLKVAGIWKDRNIDLSELRKKAWRHDNL